jgi:hypothetical protein
MDTLTWCKFVLVNFRIDFNVSANRVTTGISYTGTLRTKYVGQGGLKIR